MVARDTRSRKALGSASRLAEGHASSLLDLGPRQGLSKACASRQLESHQNCSPCANLVLAVRFLGLLGTSGPGENHWKELRHKKPQDRVTQIGHKTHSVRLLTGTTLLLDAPQKRGGTAVTWAWLMLI